jgi:hypothetical protein
VSAEARQLAAFLVIAAVVLLGAAAAAAVLTNRPVPPPLDFPALGPEDAEELIAGCIRITREAAGGC